MTPPDFDFILPDWNIPARLSKPVPWDAYMAWLEENRRALIHAGMLEKLRTDPNRCPVNVRFTLP